VRHPLQEGLIIRFVGLLLLASAAAACSNPTGPQRLSFEPFNPTGPQRLAFEARTTVSQATSITVQTVVTVTNTGPTTTQIEVSTCPRSIVAFRMSDRTGAPVWRSNAGAICDLALRLRELAPGDYFDYNLSGTFPNALPAGTYYLAADLGYSVVPAGQFIKF
jgi:hypothetical protein